MKFYNFQKCEKEGTAALACNSSDLVTTFLILKCMPQVCKGNIAAFFTEKVKKVSEETTDHFTTLNGKERVMRIKKYAAAYSIYLVILFFCVSFHNKKLTQQRIIYFQNIWLYSLK